MTLAENINKDIKEAMLARDAKKLEALRAIKSGLLLLKTAKAGSGEDKTVELEMGLLKKLVKQRKESAAIYREKGRNELAEEEEQHNKAERQRHKSEEDNVRRVA